MLEIGFIAGGVFGFLIGVKLAERREKKSKVLVMKKV